MTFDEIMKGIGGHDAYSTAIKTPVGRSALLSLLGVNFQDILRLVDTPNIVLMMTTVVAEGSFNCLMKEIEESLGRSGQNSENPVQGKSSLLQNSSQLDRGLSRSFKQAYYGAAIDGLYEYLEGCDQKYGDKYYAKFCSIVQSSGTGKTRTIIELKTKGVMVLYMNIRDDQDKNSFPLRDDIPAKILTDNLKCPEYDYSDRCMAFFTATFITVGTFLGSYEQALGTDKLVETWNDNMCDMGSSSRGIFFDSLERNYKTALKPIQITRQAILALEATQITEGALDDVQMDEQQMDSTRETIGTEVDEPIRSAVDETLQDHEMVPSSSHDTVATHSSNQSRFHRKPDLPGVEAMRSAYLALLEAFPTIFKVSSNHPKLVIAIDEAHTLSHVQDTGYRPAHTLCRAISLYSGMGCSNWVIFASTVSQVADFSAPAHIHDSFRVTVGGELLFPPYTYLGWDQMAKPQNEIKPWEVARFNNIVFFGRPLWSSYTRDSPMGIISAARIKLCKSNAFDPANSAHVLAVIGQRFGLSISFGHPDAVSYQQKAVASHLRVCLETTEDRVWNFTFYPSEPLLSYAAAQLLHESPTHLHDALRCLQRKIQGGLIDMGQKGELTSRLLLLLAKDLCVRSKPNPEEESGVDWNVELRDCRPVPVTDFLVFLFGENVLANDAEIRFKHWHVNFSHWISMDKGVKFKKTADASEWTLRHWCRTAAVQGCHNQPKIDKVIPMYYHDPASEQTEPSRFSHILVSDRARQWNTKNSLPSITSRKSIGRSTKEPYIVMLLDLRITNKPAEFTMDSDNSCLRIYAPGVTTSTYPRLDPEALRILSDTLDVPKRFNKKPNAEHLRAQMMYGSSKEGIHMKWEKGRRGLK
ncbi:hypothetical protein BDV93DRAFT_542906 [Ceratobasidium sp. AG-I]|nr:hypothetical protein BDV93DRAFT_542906 [Ceratobasidium sp. AG-I]